MFFFLPPIVRGWFHRRSYRHHQSGKNGGVRVLDEMKARIAGSSLVFEGSVELPPLLQTALESVRQEGRVVSILASHNLEAIVEQARSLPRDLSGKLSVTLKEIFLETCEEQLRCSAAS